MACLPGVYGEIWLMGRSPRRGGRADYLSLPCITPGHHRDPESQTHVHPTIDTFPLVLAISMSKMELGHQYTNKDSNHTYQELDILLYACPAHILTHSQPDTPPLRTHRHTHTHTFLYIYPKHTSSRYHHMHTNMPTLQKHSLIHGLCTTQHMQKLTHMWSNGSLRVSGACVLEERLTIWRQRLPW